MIARDIYYFSEPDNKDDPDCDEPEDYCWTVKHEYIGVIAWCPYEKDAIRIAKLLNEDGGIRGDFTG